MTKKLFARLRRWGYLLTVGMWRGECACDTYLSGRLIAITTITDEHEITKIWWEAP